MSAISTIQRLGNKIGVYEVPTRRETSDFTGTVPPVFPYICVLCNITVFSEKDWSAHVTGGQHAKSQLDLMRKYPEWDGTTESSRRNDDTSTDTRDRTSKESTADMKMSQPSSRVVSFTPLPAGDGISSELTAIAKSFGSVKKSLFLPNKGYIEMTCSADAKKLVEHYSASQLKLKGKVIPVTFSCEYNSLREAEATDDTQSRSAHNQRRSNLGRHSIPRESSSSNRRRSSERSHHVKEREDSGNSKERSGTSSNSCRSSSSAVKDEASKEKDSRSNNYNKSMNPEHYLRGLEVKADDGEELVHDISAKKGNNEWTKIDPELQVKTGEEHADTSEAVNSLNQDQTFEEYEDHEMKEEDCARFLENCVTLDELMEDNSSDFQVSDVSKSSIPKTEIQTTSQREHSEEREESQSSTSAKSAMNEEEPPSKKAKKEKPSEEQTPSVAQEKKEEEKEVKADTCESVGDVKKEQTEEPNTDTTQTQNVELKPPKDETDMDVPTTESSSVASSAGVPEKSQEPTEAPPPPTESVRKPETTLESLGPYEPNVPVGVELMKMGYYCRVCFLFYSNEDTAKKVHCSSQAHYEKLKKHLQKKSKAQRTNKKSSLFH